MRARKANVASNGDRRGGSGRRPAPVTPAHEVDLHHHGDAELRSPDGDQQPWLVDLAVNVRAGMPPAWLRERLVDAIDDVATYPDPQPAAAAIATRHDRPVAEVLPTAGGAEAFTLVARAFRPGLEVRHAVVVHPQFTEPEVALTAAGHSVHRVLLSADDGFRLEPSAVPAAADLVVVGNPTNPTSVLHPAAVLEQLARPGRLLVVDEAFMDAIPGEPESLAARRDFPGLLVLRSLTKTWGLAGVRAGYAVGAAEVIARLRAVQPPWSVSSLAIAATEACLRPAAQQESDRLARADEPVRQLVATELQGMGAHVVTPPRAPFVLLRLAGADKIRIRLRELGWAVRRGDTFPGLGPDWLRIAIRDEATMRRFLDTTAGIVSQGVLGHGRNVVH
ncbi:Rv2231c family pyridoxal phosphate-dependent protein CobC [Phytoactinopolyspora limicola]|uniref:Rv2231c family pyridoxal phosphate-dependent protein CobC n=1 Tax=Phytoactinopolyspora limicola TaxID=2715536 RepID=UPI00140C1531|nr:Rv2231c family pyridoxal phosphate-dependent protein CobC [Phytoactinopolyspora limicola]